MRLLAVTLGAGLLIGLLPSGASCTTALHDPQAGEGSPLRRRLEVRDLDPVRTPDRVETFAVEDLLQSPAKSLPTAKPIATDLPGSFFVLPDPLPVAPDLAQQISRVLLNPESYAPWQTLCIFSPGVAIRFHKGARALDIYVCFHCRELAFQVVGVDKALYKLSFDPVQEQVFALVKRARPADPRLENVRREWDREAERAGKGLEAEERWNAAMPASLRPFSQAMNPLARRDLGPMRAALLREIPDNKRRIRALLEWFGSGAGPWSGFPAYESLAEELLLTHSTEDLLAAISDHDLSTSQTEGAARLFAGWSFHRDRPQDEILLTPQLRERLLKHSLASDDRDKRERARAAFESPR